MHRLKLNKKSNTYVVDLNQTLKQVHNALLRSMDGETHYAMGTRVKDLEVTLFQNKHLLYACDVPTRFNYTEILRGKHNVYRAENIDVILQHVEAIKVPTLLTSIMYRERFPDDKMEYSVIYVNLEHVPEFSSVYNKKNRIDKINKLID